MKELTIGQKAKRYDEIIARAKGANISYYKEDIMSKVKEFVDYLLPELNESREDEMIRIIKEVILNSVPYKINILTKDTTITAEEAIAWLEKQGEQKSYWKPSKEQFEALDYAYNSCSDTERGNYYEGVLETLIEDLHRLENQGEQKSAAWCEENESHIRYLIECLEHCKKGVSLTMTTPTAQEYIDWLKSLRPQSQWKPSDNELEVLRLAAEKDGACLMGLYEQLKKLREE